jgi:hypothetical protein
LATTNEKLLAGILVATIIVAAVTIGVLVVTRSVSSSGTVIITRHDMQVYADPACTIVLNSIEWGTIPNGSIASTTIYIKNLGQNSNLTLRFNTSNWNPAIAANYITLSWNYSGQVLQPGQSIAVEMRLAVSSSATGFTAFTHQISIDGLTA